MDKNFNTIIYLYLLVVPPIPCILPIIFALKSHVDVNISVWFLFQNFVKTNVNKHKWNINELITRNILQYIVEI